MFWHFIISKLLILTCESNWSLAGFEIQLVMGSSFPASDPKGKCSANKEEPKGGDKATVHRL